MTALIWFRDDLSLADHAALQAGAEEAGGIVALYVLDEESAETRPLGGAARWWLHESLSRLRADLAALGIPLVLRRGASERIVAEVAEESRATHVFWNRRYGSERHLDARLKASMRERGIDARSFRGGLLFEPWTVATATGTPYRVYTPFWRACLALPAPAAPLPVPETLTAAALQPASEALDAWQLQPTRPNWAGGLADRWTPGETAALGSLDRFLDERAPGYRERRDFPAIDAGSELSPHLRWGEISPRTVWHRALAAATETGVDVGTFLSEVGWREFASHTLFHHTGVDRAGNAEPGLHVRGINPQFDGFPWRRPDANELAAWQRGETGFGVVDAGMRELWQSGFMHNRVRMITASFLTKNLLIDWRVGEAWFWDTLVDADAASNPFNWQWVSGCGADAAPYFRVFNPETQQHKFDRDGGYVDRWAPDSVMLPQLVDLRETRVRALAAYESIKLAPRERSAP
ncbi:cryptochrome/photolyase family protein [Leucobacter komagatae]|uniref:Deoxyribodipyrimidine photolyase n=1 Tax=Leucobacter komagatae TaxID=55969 RepID=A0A0D0ISE2_9MICO|nr:deoxyribodipyrimidine photo-lyase [Leucobacter komagatae]KIP53887.1 deoxyribodipyrimidine photolyase [Leucobacter komagatae]